MIGVLSALVAYVSLSVGKYIGRGACEAYCVEKHNLSIAITAYINDNNGALPSLEQAKAYLSGTLRYSWADENIAEGGYLNDAEDKPGGCACGSK